MFSLYIIKRSKVKKRKEEGEESKEKKKIEN